MRWGVPPYIIVPKVWRFMDAARFVCFIRLLLTVQADEVDGQRGTMLSWFCGSHGLRNEIIVRSQKAQE